MTQGDVLFLTWWLRLFVVLLLIGVPLWVPSMRRVLVAWSAYLWCRRSGAFQRESQRRWLLITTLRAANGANVQAAAQGSPR